MPTPTPNLAGRRWQANFATDRGFVAGAASAAPRSLLACVRAGAATATDRDGNAVSFASNALRATNRGVLIEAAAEQLLSNSTLSAAEVDEPPAGWRFPAGAVVNNVVRSTYKGLPAITLDITLTNSTGTAASIRVDFEPTAGITIPADRVATFHGTAAIISSTNSSIHEMRLIPRLAGGSATADQGRTAIALVAPAEFKSQPLIDPDAVALFPAVTWVVAAGTTSTVRLFVAGLQVERDVTSFIPRTPALEMRDPRYPNPLLLGAVPGDPGTLPDGWSLNTMTAARVLADNGDSLDIELTATARPTAGPSGDILGILLNVAPPGGPDGLIAGTAGDLFEAGIEAQFVSGPSDAAPRISLTAREVTGVVVSGFSTSQAITNTGAIAPVTRRFTNPLPSGGLSIALSILLSVPQSQTRTVVLRIRRNVRVDVITTSGGTGTAARPLDVVSITDPARFSGASTITIEAEQPALVEGATLLTLLFASGYRLRLVAGTQVGAIVTPPTGPDVSLLRPLYAAAGVIRLVLAYSSGTVRIGFGDACEGDAAELSIAGFDPATVTGVWLGSNNGQDGMTTVIRALDVRAGAAAVSGLAQRTRSAWFARTFVQPVAGVRGPDILSVPGYTPSSVESPGASVTYAPVGNRYIVRSNGGAAMNDVLPAADTVGAIEGAPVRLQIINNDVVPLNITSAGGLIYPPGYTLPYALDPITTLVIPAGQRALICADGYNPATQVWETDNFNWWYVLRPNNLASLDDTYEFLSVYGPPDPSNPNRAIIYPPSYCAYNADIGPPRAVSLQAVRQMNLWLLRGSQYEAARGLRFIYDACAADYWRVSIGNTTITQLKTQINNTGFPYLGLRDAGIGTPEQHHVIREWFRDRTDQTIAFFNQQEALGAATGRGNHGTAAGLAASVAAQILNRADYFEWAKQVFIRAMDELASIPGNVGAFYLEMRRADKALQYQFLNLTNMIPLAENLERMGFPAYAYGGGLLIQAINWSMAAIEDPSIVTDEQDRLIALGAPWSQGVVSAEQQPIGFGSDTDPISGEPLPNESRVAATYLAYRRLSTAQAPWRPTWASRYAVYDNVFNGTIGGAQTYLYRFPGIALPEPE